MTTHSVQKTLQKEIFTALDNGSLRVICQDSRPQVCGLELLEDKWPGPLTSKGLDLADLVIYLDYVKDLKREQALKLANSASVFDFETVGIKNFNRHKNLKASMLIIAYCGALNRNAAPVCSNSDASLLSQGRISISTFNNSVVRLEKLGLVKNLSERKTVFVKKRFAMLWELASEGLGGLRAHRWYEDLSQWLLEELDNLLGPKNEKVLADTHWQRDKMRNFRDKCE
jgi:hypothetical protein